MAECFTEFLKKQEVEYKRNKKLSGLSYIGVGGECSFALYPDTAEKLINILCFLCEKNLDFRLAGKMTNILPSDSYYDGSVIFTERMTGYIREGNLVTAECGVRLSRLIYELSEGSLGGAENLYGIPGTLGGAIVGNSGAFGSEISDIVSSVTAFDIIERKVIKLYKDELSFSYRSSIFKERPMVILSAELLFKSAPTDITKAKLKKIIKERIKKQPCGKRTLGSTFKRHKSIPVSKIIDDLGLKGYSIGGAVISPFHAGFMQNSSGASSLDFQRLIEYVKEKINSVYGFVPEEEIVIWK